MSFCLVMLIFTHILPFSSLSFVFNPVSPKFNRESFIDFDSIGVPNSKYLVNLLRKCNNWSYILVTSFYTLFRKSLNHIIQLYIPLVNAIPRCLLEIMDIFHLTSNICSLRIYMVNRGSLYSYEAFLKLNSNVYF